MEFDVLTIIAYVLTVLLAIVNWLRTGSVKSLLNKFFKGVSLMDIRKPDYRAESGTDALSQEFSNLKTEYKLNERTNELVELPDKTDLSQQIQSVNVSTLDMLLEKFGVSNFSDVLKSVEPTVKGDYANVSDDLDDIAQAMDIAEEYREKFDLPLEMSIKDIYSHMSIYQKQLGDKLDNIANYSKKGVVENVVSQENEPKQEPSAVQEHRT